MVTVMGGALEHTTVTGEVVVVVVTGDTMRNTQQRKNIYYKFHMAQDRNTSIRVIVNTPGGRGCNNTWYTAVI